MGLSENFINSSNDKLVVQYGSCNSFIKCKQINVVREGANKKILN